MLSNLSIVPGTDITVQLIPYLWYPLVVGSVASNFVCISTIRRTLPPSVGRGAKLTLTGLDIFHL